MWGWFSLAQSQKKLLFTQTYNKEIWRTNPHEDVESYYQNRKTSYQNILYLQIQKMIRASDKEEETILQSIIM